MTVSVEPSGYAMHTSWVALPAVALLEPRAALHDAHALGLQLRAHVGGLGEGEPVHAGVDARQVDARVVDVDTHLGRRAEPGADPRRGDEGLGGHAVVGHAVAAEAVLLDDGDVGLVLGGDEGRLVPGRPSTEDDDAGHAVNLLLRPVVTPSVPRPDDRCAPIVFRDSTDRVAAGARPG